jgi:two-component system, cell cycle response regulator DivK
MIEALPSSRRNGMKSRRDTNASGGAATMQRSHLVVLVVDDAPDTRYIYSRYFQFHGAQVRTASDGLEALQSVQNHPPDAIVLDLAMPRVTGWDVIRDLKANAATRAIPIVVLSGHDARDSALEAGAESYVEKPCTPQDLLDEVLRVLRRPRPRNDH